MSKIDDHPLKQHLREQAEKADQDRQLKDQQAQEKLDAEQSARKAWPDTKAKLIEEINVANGHLRDEGIDHQFLLRAVPQPWDDIEQGHITLECPSHGQALDTHYSVDKQGYFTLRAYGVGNPILRAHVPEVSASGAFRQMLLSMFKQSGIRKR